MHNKKLLKGVGVIYRYQKRNQSSQRFWELRWLPICASTEIELSKWIEERPVKKDKPKAIFASCQKFGRGQLGREWHSSRGGVWLSAAFKSEGFSPNNSCLYGLAVALALAERIEQIGINVKIKWPNDLWVDGKKLAGILPRLLFRGGELRILRVGVGLNVFNNVPIEGTSIKKIIADQKININFWSSEVLCALERSLDLLSDQEFICTQVERRLWSEKYTDKETGLKWDIRGIDSTGGLIVFKEGKEKVLSN